MPSPSPALVEHFREGLSALAAREPERLGVAVSGGPDSLALLLLAAAAFPGRVEAATVDHRLRPESEEEARFVAGICGALGVPHHILPAAIPIEGNVQSGARALRYELLGSWAAESRLACLLTAHHLDDQAETLVMRLLRGSGLAGLAGIRVVKPATGVPVLRPLLGWRRAELAAIAAHLDPITDPANADERYDRSRVRRLLAETPWLEAAPLARSAAALAEAEEALDWSARCLRGERVSGGPDRFALDPAGLPGELRRRLLLELFRMAGAPAPRGEAVQRLLATLEAGGAATLAGLKCTGGPVWRFEPETKRERH